MVPSGSMTLVEVVRGHVSRHGSKRAIVFLSRRAEPVTRTYAELDAQVRAIAARLQEQECAGQPVLIASPPGVEFVASFLACLYARAIAVPAYPPRAERQVRHLCALAEATGARRVLTSSSELQALPPPSLRPPLDGLCWIAVDAVDAAQAADFRESTPQRATAFLQYTSGSTARPKGVEVTHANLLANQAMIAEAFGHDGSLVAASWLPPYHDMGLIGSILQPLYVGGEAVLMAPTTFIRDPFAWLRAVSDYRATTSGGPNFGYDLCVDAITTEQRDTLDLSRWRVAFTGAEPIRKRTLDRFCERFGPVGFEPRAYQPCYGLAEATLLVTSGSVGKAPSFAEPPARPIAASPADAEAAHMPVVGCGSAPSGSRVVVVDTESLALCEERRSGEVWVSGPHIAAGYWNDRAASAEVFGAALAALPGERFLRTGDLGFMRDGELFVTGRIKDLIIVAGRNVHPEDIEWCAQGAHPALRRGRAAAFALEAGDAARSVLVHEVDAAIAREPATVCAALHRAVADRAGISLDEIALVRPGSVPMTSSGKVQRRACADDYRAGRIELIARWLAPDAATSGAAPGRNAAESEIAAWLGARFAALGAGEPIPPNVSLSRSGLDSMAAVRLAHAIQAHFGVRLPPASAFEDATPADLARAIREGLDEARAVPAAAPVPPAPEFRASIAQRGLWIAAQKPGAAGAYEIRAAWDIEGSSSSALQAAFETLLKRHEALRSTFSASGSELWQRAAASDDWWLCVDARDQSESELSACLRRHAAERLDLRGGPLLRVTALDRGGPRQTLVLVVHHLVADYWSLSLLLDELLVTLSGRPLPEPGGAFAQHVASERAFLEGAGAERELRYWREHLPEAVQPLRLRAPSARDAGAGSPLGTRVARGFRAFGSALNDVASAHGSTPFCVLLAAFHATLARFADSADIIVGTPTSGRWDAAFAGTIGYFVNPIMTRSSRADELSFEALLRCITHDVVRGRQHARLPLPELVAALGGQGSAAALAPFEAFFAFYSGSDTDAIASAIALDVDGVTLDRGALRVTSRATGSGEAQFGLHLCAAHIDGVLHVELRHQPEKLSEEGARALLDCWWLLLEGVLAGRQPQRLGLASLPERDRQIIQAANRTHVPSAGPERLHEWVEAAVAAHPARAALTFEGQTLTYAALNARANQLARHLRALGAGPEVPVGVYLERSIELVVALLAILKSGAFFVPLEPEHPPARTSVLLADLGHPLVLTTRRLEARLPASGRRAVALDAEPGLYASEPSSNLAPLGSKHGAAYLIYTSGSTGKPKGVINVHAGIVNRLRWMQDALLKLRADDNVLQKTPTTFDVSVWEFFSPLLAGARLTLARPGAHRNPAELAQLIRAERVTVVHFVPSMLEAFLMEPRAAECSSLRLVVASGEALGTPLNQKFHATLGRFARLYNLYGPTEAAIDVTYFECSPDAPRIPIGRAIDNVRTHVLDPKLRPVPVGFEGELVLSGVGLARGYHAAPALTAAAFIPDPLSEEPGARAYRTGDIARWLPDGTLEFLGRKDDQIKIRGMRIELGEIEAVLARAPGVRQAAVALRHVDGRALLAAFVVLEPGASWSDDDTRRRLAQHLPEHMLPSRFVLLGALPTTASGKLDRGALPPLPAFVATPAAAERGTAMERRVAALWAEALQVPSVEPCHDFFELGGQSIMAMQIVTRLQAEFPTPIPLLTLFFEDPTVTGLAAVLADSRPEDDDVALDHCFARVREELRNDAKLLQ